MRSQRANERFDVLLKAYLNEFSPEGSGPHSLVFNLAHRYSFKPAASQTLRCMQAYLKIVRLACLLLPDKLDLDYTSFRSASELALAHLLSSYESALDWSKSSEVNTQLRIAIRAFLKKVADFDDLLNLESKDTTVRVTDVLVALPR